MFSRLNRFERWLLVIGVIFCSISAAALVHRSLASRVALLEFEKAKDQVAATPARDNPDFNVKGVVDFTLWSEGRIRAYRESMKLPKGTPLAVITIGRLGIQVPVFDGVDELSLNRGVGWIAGTARPGEAGNIGIAGHRDSFFRALKDASTGDQVELATIRGSSTYTVDQIELVTPDNVAVLKPRGKPALTLVTCYPFYFVGDAPQRWIVHASLKE